MKQNNKEFFDINYIKRFQEGEEAAFNVIYEYYKNHIYYMGLQFFHHDAEKAKDLVQNTFSQVYINIDKLSAPEAFYVWMNRIAYRQGCNMLRYSSKDSGYYTNDDGEEYLERYSDDQGQPDALTKLQQEKAIQIILSDLNKMDENRRLVGYLRYFEELSIKEISEITDMPISTVSSHLRRIKGKLKKSLESKGFNRATCFSLLLVPNMITYYDAFVHLDEPMKSSNIDEIKTQSQSREKSITNKRWMVISGLVVAAAVVLPISVIVGDKIVNQENLIGEKNAAIQEVTFRKALTNEPLKLTVKTSNMNYDEMLLNDSTNLTVPFNGEYTLKLIKNNEVIDQKDIQITNIDRDVPEVTHEEISDTKIIFTLTDSDSGVDFDQITYLVNGEERSEFIVDKNNKTIEVTIDASTIKVLKVPDLAGNMLFINIDSFTK